MSQTYEYPISSRVIVFLYALVAWIGFFFFGYFVLTSPHSIGTKAAFAALALLAAAWGSWFLKFSWRLADRISATETEIVRTSLSGRVSRMSWSEIDEIRDSIALQSFELRADRSRHRIRIAFGLQGGEKLINFIASRTGHLIENSQLPILFNPQKTLLLFGCWLLSTAVFTGATISRWGSDGAYGLLLSALISFCLGLLAWLFGVNRILVEPESITIARRASARAVPYSEARSIDLGGCGNGMRWITLTLVLRNGEAVDLSYAGFDKVFLYHLLDREIRNPQRAFPPVCPQNSSAAPG